MSLLSKILVISCSLLFSGVVYAEDSLSPIPKISNQWTYSVTPYIWAPGVTSTLSHNDRYITTANLSANNVISNLKSGAMLAGEARYGNWGAMIDLVSSTLQKTGSITVSPKPGYQIHTAEKATLQQTILTGAATYTLLNNKDANIDGLLGVRWIAVTSSLNLVVDGSPTIINDAKAMSTADPIAGFKGRYRIADSSWYIPFYADIGSGGGTTNITWQAMLGIGKTIEKWADISLAYRSLYYDMSAGKNNGLLQKTTFQGPQLAVTFKF